MWGQPKKLRISGLYEIAPQGERSSGTSRASWSALSDYCVDTVIDKLQITSSSVWARPDRETLPSIFGNRIDTSITESLILFVR